MATDKQLFEDFQRLGTYALVAEKYGFNPDSVRGRVGRYCSELKNQRGEFVPFDTEGVHLHRAPNLASTIIIRNKPLVVAGDYHFPLSFWEFFELTVRFGEKHLPKGNRRLAIVGDLLNLDAMSRYDHIIAPFSLESEIDYGERAFEYLFKVFDEVYMTWGNHDVRFAKSLQGSVSMGRLAQLLSKEYRTGRLIVAQRGQMIATYGGTVWRLTHQVNYSKNKGIVANDLAIKHQCNIVDHHQHHVNKQRDRYNRYTTIDNGMIGDPEKMAYVQLFDSTMPEMCHGFTYLDGNGNGELLTPYPTFTAWDRWNMEREALPSIVESDAKMKRRTMPNDILQAA